MPKYRISAEVVKRGTVGYKKSTLQFTEHIGDAQLVTLTPTEARNWLSHNWFHFKRGYNGHGPMWKGCRIDQVRLVLEEIDGDSARTIATTANWDMAVTSGGAVP